MDALFFVNSVLMGLGLTMDAFSASVANGLNEPHMSRKKAFGMAATFAFFQGLMPLLGWVCVHAFVSAFTAFRPYVPYIALVLLTCIGAKMILESVKEGRKRTEKEADEGAERGTPHPHKALGFGALLLQGLATSIDALSVGFTIAPLPWYAALVEAAIIAFITLLFCLAGGAIGKRFGKGLANKAGILGGVVLILIGVEIFVSQFF